jgi:uncharacterized protein YbjT (DUF2867 family)
MRILVTGASGFVGSLMVARLHREGHQLRALARDPAALRLPPSWGVEVVRGDVLTGAGLTAALTETQVAYYLIHSMDGQSGSAFLEGERRAAENFAAAAQDAGVARIVYLGGPVPPTDAGPLSRHLASRLGVERTLLDAVPQSVALRSSIVIGARSRSFRFLVRLIERMPVLALPSWQRFRTQPIDARDVTEMLLAAATEPAVAGRSLDIGGPETLSYGEMIERIVELMGLGRPALGLRVSMTPIAARVAAAIAAEDPDLILPLMESLGSDLLPADDHAAELLGVPLHSFDSAVEHALGEWEAVEPLAAR